MGYGLGCYKHDLLMAWQYLCIYAAHKNCCACVLCVCGVCLLFALRPVTGRQEETKRRRFVCTHSANREKETRFQYAVQRCCCPQSCISPGPDRGNWQLSQAVHSWILWRPHVDIICRLAARRSPLATHCPKNRCEVRHVGAAVTASASSSQFLSKPKKNALILNIILADFYSFRSVVVLLFCPRLINEICSAFVRRFVLRIVASFDKSNPISLRHLTLIYLNKIK